jgi:RNA polymerase sigma factor (TIGR02999 family)
MNDPALPPDVTSLLQRVRSGDDDALDDLMPVVYEELRRIARRHLRGQAAGHTLQTTALVHEAFLRLARGRQAGWTDRVHFYAVAATAMRQVLVDHARRRGASKRGGDYDRVGLATGDLGIDTQAELMVEIDDALQKLSALDPRLTRVVECRFFAGMSEPETAAALGVTDRTVRRDWVKARAWLHRELDGTTD